MPTADNNAQPAGFNALIAPWTVLFALNLSKILKTKDVIIKDGKIIEIVAIKEPNIPVVVKPA